MRERDSQEEKDDPNFWMTTFSDLLNLLLTFFVLLFAMKAMDKGKLLEALGYFRGGGMGTLELGREVQVSRPDVLSGMSRVQRVFSPAELKRVLMKRGLGGKIGVSSDQRGLILTMQDTILFDSARAEIKSEAREVLKKLAAVLGETDYPIRIEGHTDNVPIYNSQYSSNWDLSIARAVQVLQYLLRQGGLSPERFSVAGYADTRPILPNNTQENRNRNRRVELVLLK